ncbi:caspase domain-containing protein [Mucilaginibacter calamicampi]|uniref:Caspase domain-containing protein n=1 Tax=Mucilaginibacter calamicampi TaxID=1302352 RepID=A0ABW2YVD6_9SPHI
MKLSAIFLFVISCLVPLFVFSQASTDKQLPELVYQPSPNSFILNFSINKDASQILINSNTDVVLFDIIKSRIINTFKMPMSSIRKCQFSESGDSVLITSLEYADFKVGQSLTHANQLTILSAKTFAPVDIFKTEFIELSDDSRYVLHYSLSADGPIVKLVKTSDKSEVLRFTETDKQINSLEVVNHEIRGVYAALDSDRLAKEGFKQGSFSGLQVQGRNALITIMDIKKLWDLNTKNVLSRFDNIAFKKPIPLDSDPIGAELQVSMLKWKLPSSGLNIEKYLLLKNGKVAEISGPVINYYDTQANLLSIDSLGIHYVDNLFDFGETKIRTVDGTLVDFVKPISDGQTIQSVKKIVTIGEPGSTQRIVLDDKKGDLENSNVRLFKDFLISADKSTIKIWDLRSGEIAADLYFTFKDNFQNQVITNWLTVSRQSGFFDTENLENAESAKWDFNEQLTVYPLEIFMKDFYQPQLFYKTLLRSTFQKPIKKFSSVNRKQPELRMTNFKQVNDRQCTVDIELAGETDAYAVHIFRDKKLIKVIPETGDAGSFLSTARVAKDDPRLKNILISLPEESLSQVRLSCYAFNNDRVKSITRENRFPVKQSGVKKGDLVVLTIAVASNENSSMQLTHPVVETKEFYDNINNLVDKSEFNKIRRLNLFSEAVTEYNPKATLLTTKKAIKQSLHALSSDSPDRINPEDILIIYYSGHGQLDSTGKFYMVPYDYKVEQPYESAISSYEFSSWIENIDAKSVFVFIDACYSGGVENTEYISGPFGDPGFGQLSYNKLIPILTSARADQLASSSGSGLINLGFKSSSVKGGAKNLFDLMTNISANLSSRQGKQRPQFLFWGKDSPSGVRLK